MTAGGASRIGLEVFRCPESGAPLHLDADALVDPSGKRWPIVDGIPRFVSSEAYTSSFGFEWNVHSSTQFDAHMDGASERELRQKTGLGPDQVTGRLVLDAGVGAGRYTDVLSRWGARVVGIDLSRAVEAAHGHFRERANVKIAQADIARLPFAPETFDLVVSIGVLHHTPDTRTHFFRLIPFLKPGGEIAVWVYPRTGDYKNRNAWIPFTHRIPATWFYAWCRGVVPLIHKHRGNPFINYFRRVFPISDQGLGLENDILDTFDGYSPTFHGIHTSEEVQGWFHEAGLVDVRVMPWHGGTAVRGRKTLADDTDR